ncbi:Glycine cleavage system transcriptional activator [Andreprevotia sp. IGB-42]|uniref:transcriptional regulator GcvA n=1 Tax=Andreprevotia sp. IGB-42 TaxID=2497473 RepID=UPI0013579E3D|nr:transcriptional regulator GcvA [Andreprevotia sp. IGB-42]KAF0813939.1 Glycine cleavage system transcriptional activator [Andreprevotia sp. IGB-42]
MNSPLKAPGRLPSLPALRAFEAAARLGNMAQAAEELFVTPGAVSHQVKALEEQLGYALFIREGRGVRLTAEGRRLAGVLNGAFGTIAAEVETMRRERERPRVVITCVPSFAAKWLTPRLKHFIGAHPEIELWVHSSLTREDIAAQGIDLAIRVGRGVYPGLYAQHFMEDDFIVVASPALAGGLPRQPAGLAGRMLLRSNNEPWRRWFDEAGLNDWPEPSQGIVFNDSALLVQAAAEGQGIALARRLLIQDEVASGRLVPLFDLTVPLELPYWLVTTTPPPHRPALQLFIDWLWEQARLDGVVAAG